MSKRLWLLVSLLIVSGLFLGAGLVLLGRPDLTQPIIDRWRLSYQEWRTPCGKQELFACQNFDHCRLVGGSCGPGRCAEPGCVPGVVCSPSAACVPK